MSQIKTKLVLKFGFSLILFGIIVWQLGGLRELGRLMSGFDAQYIPLILLFNTADRGLMTFKWAWLLRGRGLYLPFLTGMRIYCASMVWGMFLPSTMGADVIRAFSASGIGLSSREVVASIIIERMFGFISALLFGLLSLIILTLFSVIDSRFDFLWWIAGSVLVGAAVFFVGSFAQSTFNLIHNHFLYRFRDTQIMQKLRHFHLTYRAYQENKASLVTFFALTFGEQLVPILHTWLVAHALGVDIGLLYLAGAVPLTLLVSRIPISIAGIGVYDGIFVLLMSLAGMQAAEAISICLVGRIMEIASWLPWWLAQIAIGGTLRPTYLSVGKVQDRIVL